MSLRGFLRRAWPFSWPASGPESEPEREPVTSLPDGYQEAAVGFEDFDSPAEFDAPVPDIHCDLCGETFASYWSWFGHARDEHSFASIEEARSWATIIVPSGHDSEIGDALSVDVAGIPAEENDGQN